MSTVWSDSVWIFSMTLFDCLDKTSAWLKLGSEKCSLMNPGTCTIWRSQLYPGGNVILRCSGICICALTWATAAPCWTKPHCTLMDRLGDGVIFYQSANHVSEESSVVFLDHLCQTFVLFHLNLYRLNSFTERQSPTSNTRSLSTVNVCAKY